MDIFNWNSESTCITKIHRSTSDMVLFKLFSAMLCTLTYVSWCWTIFNKSHISTSQSTREHPCRIDTCLVCMFVDLHVLNLPSTLKNHSSAVSSNAYKYFCPPLSPCRDLDGDLWPTLRSNLLPSGGPQFSEFACYSSCFFIDDQSFRISHCTFLVYRIGH